MPEAMEVDDLPFELGELVQEKDADIEATPVADPDDGSAQVTDKGKCLK